MSNNFSGPKGTNCCDPSRKLLFQLKVNVGAFANELYLPKKNKFFLLGLDSYLYYTCYFLWFHVKEL